MPKIVFISDTHSLHRRITLPEGDILVHAGDWQNSGRDWQDVFDFANWWNGLDFKHKILVDGNHDGLAQTSRNIVKGAFQDTHYLLDSSVTIEGLKFYGSPWTPTFCEWFFMKDRGEDIRKVWDEIPNDTNILITHGPPWGYLDQAKYRDPNWAHLGCVDLAETLPRLKSLKVHCFGHIHGSYGIEDFDNDAKLINASQVNEEYKVVNKPIVIDL